MDLVDQLRGKAKGQCVPMGAYTFEAAADEIEALRAQVAGLERVIQAIVNQSTTLYRDPGTGECFFLVPDKVFNAAHQALKG